MLISVCIPTYNQGKYIEQCLKSVIEQSLRPNEIIVSNDCSTDNTVEELEKLHTVIPILKVIHHPKNLGISANTNACLRAAKGELIVRLDSDDLLLPNYVEKLVALMNKYPEAGYAHAAVKEINANGDFLKIRELARSTGFQDSNAALKASIKGYRVAANILMFRRDALEKVGFISSQINFAEDYYLSAQIASAGFGNVYNKNVLSCYRVWTDAGKARKKRKLDEINGLRAVYEEVIEPAFIKRGWNSGIVTRKKKQFACAQSNCLMWNIYSKQEKNELEVAIFRLSTAYKVKLYTFLYKNGLGKLITIPSDFIQVIKQVIKKIIYSY